MSSTLGISANLDLTRIMSDVWIRSQEEVTRIDRLAEEIGTIQSLKNSFQPILTIILVALDAPAIFMRTKALRALGQIITSDATILGAVCRCIGCFPNDRSMTCLHLSQMFDVPSKVIFWITYLLFAMLPSSR
jgi:hypothetical protein